MTITRRVALSLLTTASLWAGLCGPAALAQDAYPSKPITLIVPYGPGGAVDLVARVIADGLRAELGQPVVIENRTGGNGLIGMRAAAAAPADGYTLILSSESNHVALPLLQPDFPLDVEKSFTPLSQSGQFQHTLVVKSTLPIKSVADFVRYAKANPGKLSFGSSGIGTTAHMAGELLSQETGGKMVHVPYRGSAAAMTDLLGGTLDVNVQSLPALRAYFDSPGVRILAVLSAKRLKDMPNLPTMAESGFPDFVFSSMMGMFAPAGLPDDVRKRLVGALVKVGQNRDLQMRIRATGTDPVGSDDVAFAELLKAEKAKWTSFVAKTGIQLK